MSGSLRLNGSTSGFSEITAPDVAGDQTFTLPAVGGTLSTVGIRQIVEGSTSTKVDNTTDSWMDTGLTATITPTSPTSKILVIINQYIQIYRAASENGYGIKVLRGSEEIDVPVLQTPDKPLSRLITAGDATAVHIIEMYSRTLLDSPNSTQAVTYKTQGKAYQTANLNYFYCQPSGTESSGTSNIYLIEVAL
jgi:hypothetical protein